MRQPRLLPLLLPLLLLSASSLACAHAPGARQSLGESPPGHDQRRLQLRKELKELETRLFEAENRGEEVSCASQISNETSWLLGSTAELDLAQARVADLRAELAKPPSERKPDRQSKTDGSWGRCFTEWFFKLSLSGDHILALAEQGKTPKYRPRFLDPVNSPEKLRAYLDSVLVTDPARVHRIQRRELNESTSTLVRLILRNLPRNYSFDPRLKGSILEYIHKTWQNPESGYWGAWFRRKDGTIQKTDDLSITFHLVSYLEGKVSRLDKIFKTTLAIKDAEYPQGWLADGKYENHHNYDVVRLLRYGWSDAAPEDRAIAAREIRKMLDWCLSKSLQPDGSFVVGSSDDSVEDSYYFGVSFLDEAGFFDPAKRFWTAESLPPSAAIRDRIARRIRQAGTRGGKSGVYYRSALKKLGSE